MMPSTPTARAEELARIVYEVDSRAPWDGPHEAGTYAPRSPIGIAYARANAAVALVESWLAERGRVAWAQGHDDGWNACQDDWTGGWVPSSPHESDAVNPYGGSHA
jgi:hypothetical protein